VLGHLPFIGSAHNLADTFNHVAEATGTTHRLATGKLAAIGVYREFTSICRIHRIEKGTNLALVTYSGIFEAHGLKDSVSIVKFCEFNVLSAVPRHFQSSTC